MTNWQYTGMYWIVYSNFLFAYFLKNQLTQQVNLRRLYKKNKISVL